MPPLRAADSPMSDAARLHPPEDPEQRLEIVVRAFLRIIVDTEAQQRTMLRLSLEEDPDRSDALPLRQGRAIGWFAEALAPLRGTRPDEALHRVAVAVRSAAGIDALVWLTDVARLSRADAVELMCGTARALLQAALRDHA